MNEPPLNKREEKGFLMNSIFNIYNNIFRLFIKIRIQIFIKKYLKINLFKKKSGF